MGINNFGYTCDTEFTKWRILFNCNTIAIIIVLSVYGSYGVHQLASLQMQHFPFSEINDLEPGINSLPLIFL